VLFGFQLGIFLFGGNKDKKRRRALMKKDLIEVYIERFSFGLLIISGDLGKYWCSYFWAAGEEQRFCLQLGVLFGLLICQLKKEKYFDDMAVASRPACFLYEMSALLRCWLSFFGEYSRSCSIDRWIFIYFVKSSASGVFRTCHIISGLIIDDIKNGGLAWLGRG